MSEIQYSLNDTIVNITDPEREQLRIAYFKEGRRPLSQPEEVIVSVETGHQVRMHPKELIEAIAKISGLRAIVGKKFVAGLADGSFAPVTPAEPEEPKSLWGEYRERPVRAVKVTPEFVRFLADTREHTEHIELNPKFSANTGEPKGVEFYDPGRFDEVLAKIGQVVVLRPGAAPRRLEVEEFENTYMEATA